MRHTLVILLFFLLGASEACMGQIGGRSYILENQIKNIDMQIKQINDVLRQDSLMVQNSVLQKELNTKLGSLITVKKAVQKELDKVKTVEECMMQKAPQFADEPLAESKSTVYVTSKIQSQSTTKRESANDLQRDKRTVTNYINQGNSTEAYNYLKKKLEENYPSDPYEQFDYAALLQNIIVGLTNDGINVAYSTDLGSAMIISGCLTGARAMQAVLHAKAASNGHEGAKLMLQVQSSMYGGGNMYTTPTNDNSNGSYTAKKTCTLCNGKGWIAGSKTPTYGNNGTHWCNECGRNVNASHSHDRCPSCAGRGYR
ncbi:hypothetical protein DW228_18300 [Bacteroides fragilis]|uniref:Uncharacterized protein n=1 Tax=Bacteroides fragilis TaxID=817 RepID=A0A396BVT0_BACFG|nr:hypothetical protein [Bacteroides fragilis]RHH07885.1 hypothetical protein DW228_18300 [Bacteroides fragilis]